MKAESRKTCRSLFFRFFKKGCFIKVNNFACRYYTEAEMIFDSQNWTPCFTLYETLNIHQGSIKLKQYHVTKCFILYQTVKYLSKLNTIKLLWKAARLDYYSTTETKTKQNKTNSFTTETKNDKLFTVQRSRSIKKSSRLLN